MISVFLGGLVLCTKNNYIIIQVKGVLTYPGKSALYKLVELGAHSLYIYTCI